METFVKSFLVHDWKSPNSFSHDPISACVVFSGSSIFQKLTLTPQSISKFHTFALPKKSGFQ